MVKRFVDRGFFWEGVVGGNGNSACVEECLKLILRNRSWEFLLNEMDERVVFEGVDGNGRMQFCLSFDRCFLRMDLFYVKLYALLF